MVGTPLVTLGIYYSIFYGGQYLATLSFYATPLLVGFATGLNLYWAYLMTKLT